MCSTVTMRAKRLIVLGLAAALWASAQVHFKRTDGRIDVEIDGRPFTSFYFGPDQPKPYLHPLRAPDGTIVTRRYPMEKVAGENRDHPHHRGLWFSHGDVNGLDFWSNELTQEPRDKKGRIRLRHVKQTAAGDGKRGTISAAFEWNTPSGELLLTEEREMVFYAGLQNRVIDFDLKLTAAKQSVRLGDTKEGTFAVRVATELEEDREEATGVPRTGRIVSATGNIGEIQAWGKRAPWVDYSGTIDSKKLGIAIFDHPGNPRHPTHWHVRSYGLFAANIFGEHDFYEDESRDASITLDPGKALRFRYRVVIHPGDTETAEIGKLYENYAAVE